MEDQDVNQFNQKSEWFYVDTAEKTAKGPVSIRDLGTYSLNPDVLIRTNNLNSNSFVWKEGMSDWQKLYTVEDLKDLIITTSNEINESLLRNKIQTIFSQKDPPTHEDNFYLGIDGFWHVFDPKSKQWSTQVNKPMTIREIEKSQLEMNSDDIIIEEEEELNEDEELRVGAGVENNSTNLLNQKRKKSESLDNSFENTKSDEIKKFYKKLKKKEKQKQKKKKTWYEPKIKSTVYTSGLPNNITEIEVATFFSKSGLIRRDPETGEYKVKLYKNEDGTLKGDGIISYIREESVPLAIDMLNDTEIKPGFKIKVESAKFEQKGNYKLRNAQKLDELKRFKYKTDIDRLLGWNEETEEKGLRIVVLKHMFEPVDFEEDENLRNDIEMDITDECNEKFGEIDKFVIFDQHPEGVIKIKFKAPASAERCIEALNGRFYNGRQVDAGFWDGKTDYSKVKEDLETQMERIEEFGKWLEEEKESKESTPEKEEIINK